MVEVEKGVLIIGLSNTVLFGGEQSAELILLNVATGQDFWLPQTPDQTDYLFEQISIQNMLNIPEETEHQCDTEECATDHADSRDRLNDILEGKEADAKKHEDAWESAETASQF